MTTPLLIQLIGLLLAALVLDGGVMLKCFLVGSLFYWLFFLYKRYRCDSNGNVDQFLLKYGILVFFACIYGLVLFGESIPVFFV